MQQFHLAPKSRNVKTGPIPVSTTTSNSCPPTCPFIDAGCYAKRGQLGMHWAKVNNGAQANVTELPGFLTKIAALKPGQLWRHNAAGDLPGDGGKIDKRALRALTKANAGRRGFTYTHKPMGTRANRDAVRDANAGGFTINLSANNLKHADKLMALDIAPVVVVLPSDTTENTTTPAGHIVVVCPATQRDNVTCASCGLCQRKRGTIVGFPAHGASKAKASAIATS